MLFTLDWAVAETVCVFVCVCLCSGWRSWRRLWWQCNSLIKIWATSARGFLVLRLICLDPSRTACATIRRSRRGWLNSRYTKICTWYSLFTLILIEVPLSTHPSLCFTLFSSLLLPLSCCLFCYSIIQNIFLFQHFYFSASLSLPLTLRLSLLLIIHICPLFNFGRGHLHSMHLWTDV